MGLYVSFYFFLAEKNPPLHHLFEEVMKPKKLASRTIKKL